MKLVVTNEQRLDDVYFRSTTDGVIVETSVSGRNAADLTVRHALLETDPREARQSQPLRLKDRRGVDQWQLPAAGDVAAAAQHGLISRIGINDVQPRLWSPEQPDLYWLKTELLSGETVVDERITTVGFRTFEVRNGKFYLNGKPYFLRGDNMPPAGIQPNNGAGTRTAASPQALDAAERESSDLVDLRYYAERNQTGFSTCRSFLRIFDRT
ncbi:MAG TPA: hypothetical protein VGR35_12910 [Tepidisphaeraceae bacterium]|nr:hypothetical protein [Tepidisphaeraceae bacterium]